MISALDNKLLEMKNEYKLLFEDEEFDSIGFEEPIVDYLKGKRCPSIDNPKDNIAEFIKNYHFIRSVKCKIYNSV